MTMFLTSEEVLRLTGKKNRPAQVTALNMMGIEHKVRPDGKVIVSRSHVENIFSGVVSLAMQSKETYEPNWGAI